VRIPYNLEERFKVSSSPHVRKSWTVRSVMLDVLIALIPAVLASWYFFGIRAMLVELVCVLAAVLSEAIVQYLFFEKVTVDDLSAVVTGLLLAMCLPPSLPLWIAAVGSIVAIIIGKQVFGGLGNNPFNPAHVGRAVLLASWPVYMTTWMVPTKPGTSQWLGTDIVTSATPLGMLKESGYNWAVVAKKVSLWDLWIGNVGGSLGETSAIAILIGGLYLLWRGVITWHIPVTYLGTVFLLSLIFEGPAKHIADAVVYPPLFHLAAGGLMIGAWFMATDMVTTPLSKGGRIAFGIGAGVLVFLIRKFGGYPEGVCYSILIMNAFTPLLDRIFKPKTFGEVTQG